MSQPPTRPPPLPPAPEPYAEALLPPSSVEEKEGEKEDDDKSKIWITMGLCWSENTKFHDKGQFPYKAAAPLAARYCKLLF